MAKKKEIDKVKLSAFPEEVDKDGLMWFGEMSYETQMAVLSHYLHADIQNLPEGYEKEILVRQRVNQQFFRDAVLAAYQSQCCITGISNASLLEACHISGWTDDENNRTNPRNGLCMTPTFHRAYDKYLMAITPDYYVVISDKMLCSANKDENTMRYFMGLQGRQMRMPEKFAPDRDLLAKHFEEYNRRI